MTVEEKNRRCGEIVDCIRDYLFTSTEQLDFRKGEITIMIVDFCRCKGWSKYRLKHDISDTLFNSVESSSITESTITESYIESLIPADWKV